jgi:hypothetical protein
MLPVLQDLIVPSPLGFFPIRMPVMLIPLLSPLPRNSNRALVLNIVQARSTRRCLSWVVA